MDPLPVVPKIARAQAMERAFGLSTEEMSLLFPWHPSPTEGKAWEKRPREQQRAAMLWVLNRLFCTTFCGLPLGDRDPQTRRDLLLNMCRERSSRLEKTGWSMHDIMDWLIEINQDHSWSQDPHEL